MTLVLCQHRRCAQWQGTVTASQGIGCFSSTWPRYSLCLRRMVRTPCINYEHIPPYSYIHIFDTYVHTSLIPTCTFRHTYKAIHILNHPSINIYTLTCKCLPCCLGVCPYVLDCALIAYGFPIGPLQMADLAGLDVLGRIRKVLLPGHAQSHTHTSSLQTPAIRRTYIYRHIRNMHTSIKAYFCFFSCQLLAERTS